jgi:hypothetical protein
VVGTLALLCAPRPAGAWCVKRYKLNPPTTKYGAWVTLPVKYRVSDSLTDSAIAAAIDKAFATWGSVKCSKLTFTPGTFSMTAIPFKQGTNAIFIYWVKDQKDWPAGVDPKNYLYSFGGYDMNGATTSASLAFNAFNYTWNATGGSATAFDVQSMVTHTLGWALGFEKSQCAGSNMAQDPGFGLTPNLQALAPDDNEAVAFMYPSGAAGCTPPPAPVAAGTTPEGNEKHCSQSCGAPPPTGDGKPPADTGPQPPKGDGQVTPPKGDGPTPPKGDGGPVTPKGDGSGTPPGGDGAKSGTGCKYTSQCGADEICSAEGNCVKVGGGDSGCCRVSHAGGEPLTWLQLALVGVTLLLALRRRRHQ